MTQGDRFAFVDPGQKQTLEDIHDAIAVATGDLGLLPGVAFQARVAQLAQLNSAHQTVSCTGHLRYLEIKGNGGKHFEFSEVRDKQIETKKLNSLTLPDFRFPPCLLH